MALGAGRVWRLSAQTSCSINSCSAGEVGVERRNPAEGATQPAEPILSVRLFVYLSLAIAVFLWGTTYKLSLYHHHPRHSAQVKVAKFWLGPRSHHLVQAARLSTNRHYVIDLQAIVVSRSWNSSSRQTHTHYPSPDCDSPLFWISSSSRAPPSRNAPVSV